MSSASVFFQTPELVLRLAWTVVFKTLVAISHINRVARRSAKRVFLNKICRNVGKAVVPATHDSLSRRRRATLLILKTLQETESWITGSVALASFIFAPNTATPHMRGLDVLVPFPALRRWKLTLERDLSFDKGKESVPRSELRQSAVSVTRFCRIECIVNIITLRASVIPAVVASRLTSQMNLFNGDVAVSIYPTLTTNKYGLLAWPAAVNNYTAWHQLDHSRTVPFRTHLDLALLEGFEGNWFFFLWGGGWFRSLMVVPQRALEDWNKVQQQTL
ncbi:hypothetical protein C8R43DRAFT_1118536 [Mycena crocata]|nr:hypothetical protein C8R43DRAFT_1118536 [Mycena crocata]